MAVVITYRDPDASNEHAVYTNEGEEVFTVDVDYGRMDLHDAVEFAEWRESKEADVAVLRARGDYASDKAAQALEGAIAEAAENYGHGVQARKEADYALLRGRSSDFLTGSESTDRTNLDRALNGRDMAALAATGSSYLAYEDYEAGLVDALANLMHFARRYEIDFDAELDRARMHHDAEKDTLWDEVPDA